MFASLRVAACCAALLPLSVRAQAQQSTESLGADTLDRGAFVRAVLKENPSIEAARQSFRAARARARQAGAFEDPMIELSMAPLSIGSSNASFGYEVGISQALPWLGTRGLEQDAMAAEADASASDLEVTRRELAMAAIALYGRYFVAYRSLEINAVHASLLRALRSAATAQLEAGRGSAQDALQAEAELAYLERDALALEAERDVVVAQMNELLHRAPEAQLPPPVAVLVSAASPSATDAQRFELEAVAKRAEISAVRKRADAEAAKADAAGRASLPTVTVSTSYSSMWEMAEHRWMVGVGINVPLPTEWRSGAVDEARAMRAMYQSEAERMTSMARTEVHVALRKLDESDRTLALFEQRIVPVARARVDAAQASFAASQSPLTMVIDAEKNLRAVELERQLAQAERDQRRAELDRALGRIPGIDGQESSP